MNKKLRIKRSVISMFLLFLCSAYIQLHVDKNQGVRAKSIQPNSSSQSSYPHSSPVAQWRTITKDDGLASNYVNAMMEDRNGHFWIGTDKGVTYYDGKTWLTYTTSNGLLGERITALLEDQFGNILIGTDKGVNRYNGKIFEPIVSVDNFGNNCISDMLQETKGAIWFASRCHGVVRFSKEKNELFTKENGLSSDQVSSLLQDNHGNVWVGTYKGGISQYDGKNWKTITTTAGLADNTVLAMLQDKQGNIWVGTDDGLNRYDGKNWETFTESDGLIHNTVTAILQDSTGGIWIGMYPGGVNYYDGTKWQAFTTKDGLAPGYVKSILQDRTGDIWVGTQGGGISHYDGKTWQSFVIESQLVSNQVLALLQDSSNDIWVGTENGVSRYNGDTWKTYTMRDGLTGNSVTSLLQDHSKNIWFGTNNGLSRYDGMNWHTYSVREGLVANNVTALIEDHVGTLWIGTNGGVSSYDGKGWKSFDQTSGLISNNVTAILEDHRGKYWFGTSSGISSYDGKTWENYQSQTDGLVSDKVNSLLQDKDGNIWVGTDDGLSRFNGTSWRTYTTTDGLPSDHVNTLLQDKDGNIWVGTNSGVGRYDGSNWSPVSEATKFSYVMVVAILQDYSGGLWFGTKNDGISRYYLQNRQDFSERVGQMDDIRAVVYGKDNSLWVGTYGDGISHFDGNTWKNYTTDDGLARDYITSLLQDRSGDLWVGTADEGISRYDGKNWQTYTTTHGLANDYINTLLQDKDGNIWVGTDNGLSRFNGTGWRTYSITNGLADNYVHALLQDRSGDLWVGTDGGLGRFNGTSWRTYTTTQGLSDIKITSLLQDYNGGIWAGTFGGGVSHYDGVNWETFTVADGLAGNSVSQLVQDTATNKIMVLTDKGISIYDITRNFWTKLTTPEGVADKAIIFAFQDRNGVFWFSTDEEGTYLYAPSDAFFWGPMFVAITSGDRRYPIYDKEIDVDAQNQGFKFDYRVGEAASYANDVYVFYRLRSIDSASSNITMNSWILQTKQRGVADFSSIIPPFQPGRYIFEVQARNKDGIYSDILQSPVINVAKPPLNIPIIPSIVVALSVGAIVGVITYRRLTTSRKLRIRYNPYIAGDPIIDESAFYGRNRTINGIIDAIRSNHILIYGDRRIGKTSVLYQIRNRLRKINSVDKQYYYVPIYWSLQGLPEDQFFARLMSRIAREAGVVRSNLRIAENNTEYDNIDAQEDLDCIVIELQERMVSKELRIILLLDEMDTFDGYNMGIHEQFRALLQSESANKLKVVGAGVAISKNMHQRTSPWFNLFGSERELLALQSEDAFALIVDSVKDIYTWDKQAVEEAIAMTHGKPHDIQRLCREAVNNMLDAGRRRILIEDVIVAFNNLNKERDEEYRIAWQNLSDRQREILRVAKATGGIVASNYYTGAKRSFSRIELYPFIYVDGPVLRLTRSFSFWLEADNA